MSVYVPLSELRWHAVADELPVTEGVVLIYAPSLDPKMPLVATAWFTPGEGFSVLAPWIKAISHWMHLPDPPAEEPAEKGDRP